MFSGPSSQLPLSQKTSLLSGILSGPTGPKDSPSISLLSNFSGPTPQQDSPQTTQTPESTVTELDVPKEYTQGKGDESISGIPSPEPATHQEASAPDTSPPSAAPQKEPLNTGLFSMFTGPSPQQPTSQTGSFLDGLLFGSSGPKEAPGKGLLSMFTWA